MIACAQDAYTNEPGSNQKDHVVLLANPSNVHLIKRNRTTNLRAGRRLTFFIVAKASIQTFTWCYKSMQVAKNL
jgi:hypothetical protein